MKKTTVLCLRCLRLFRHSPYGMHPCLKGSYVRRIIALSLVLLLATVPFLHYTQFVLKLLVNKRRVIHSAPQLSSESTKVVQPLEHCPWAPLGRSPLEGRWFNYSSISFQLYVFTALLDDRESLRPQSSNSGQLPAAYVRLISVATRDDVLKAKQVNITLFCRLYYHQGWTVETRVIAVDPEPKPVGFGWSLNGETVCEYIYACPLYDIDSAGIPTAVSVIRKDGNEFTQVESCVPVERPARPASPAGQRGMAICVPVAFGNLDPHRLIEWIEMQRILGVELIVIYSLDVNGTGLEVLRRYDAEDGLVELWTTSYLPDGPMHNILHSTPVVNDCIYRHMHEFRRIAVLDLDELIIPESTDVKRLDDLVDLLDSGFKDRPFPASYVFRNSYFFTDIPNNQTDISPSGTDLTLLRHRKKVGLSSPGYSVKSIIDPQACVNMHNHYCWSQTPGFTQRPVVDVDPRIATNRHYKQCHFDAATCATMITNVTNDDVMLRFQDHLQQRVKRKIASDFADLKFST